MADGAKYVHYGVGRAACGSRYHVNGTFDRNRVTCPRCLLTIANELKSKQGNIALHGQGEG